MKTINIALSLLTMAAAMASCSDSYDELPVAEPQTEITASFRISVPTEAGTRADGDEATGQYTLEWTVFDVTDSANPKIFIKDSKTLESLSAEQTLELQLIKEMQYKITFCAYNAGHQSFAHYDEGKVMVNYSAAGSIQLGDDLFIAASDTFKATRDLHEETVTLTRPFAQLNWGASDLEAITVSPYLEGTTACVTVESGLYQTLDLLTGEYSDPVDGAFTFDAFDCSKLPDVEHDIPMYKEKYRLLASNLLLIGENSATIDCKMTFSGNIDAVAEVKNAPLEKNFRTNIYGGLISDPASLNLSINDYFEDGKDVTSF